MRWFDNWFTKKVHWANNTADEGPNLPNLIMTGSKRAQRSPVTSRESGELESRGTAFTLYNANGGHVVELRHYDEKSDRMKNSLHVVPHEQDLGEALNHIITYEALKR